jgi:hypothetical protein
LSWDDTVERCNNTQWHIKTGEQYHMDHVPVLYRGVYDEEAIKALYTDDMQKTVEGYVIRPAGSFQLKDFQQSIAKFVRKGHVQTDQHWMWSGGERNMLRLQRN